MESHPMNSVYDKNGLLFKDEQYYIRLGWLIVLIGIIGFLGWAILAPLDAGVPIDAKVVVSGNRKAVQPLVGGKVQRILVMEGERVQAGQVLVELDSTLAMNQLDSLRFQFLNGLATENRLMAERDGLSEINFDNRLLKEQGSNQQVNEIILAQQQLFESRLHAQRAMLDGLEATLRGTREQNNSAQRVLNSLQNQRKGFEQQLKSQRLLATDGLLARNRLLETERQYYQLIGSIADEQGRLGSLRASINDYHSRLISQREGYQKELRTELNDVRTRLSDLQSKLNSAQYEATNMQVISPAAGIVTGLSVFTQGGIINAGDRLMDIVPLDKPLIVEGMLPVQGIDKIYAGLPVELEFMSFSRASTPKLMGTVQTVSADRIEDSQNDPYYRVEIKISDLQGREISPGLELMPGMPVTAFIQTGERTLMSYLLKPLRDRTRLALTEK
ncbi:HlyD family type I secretion periplasmic adaptor subunit [Citrobacter koseri]|uniref:HlyD family type I secretion periplasmic adaptor subunit n=1 Tax=Citrobacter koseri TaxID=545 RepID=UPI0028BDE95B|nr:HlyD family type I secretion periplasmic adaptor subunit [Citrobacter koseri]MDT7487290.1 HlyD family type I secretion periplasmic adaptor subunit [Citrobacter koseri]